MTDPQTNLRLEIANSITHGIGIIFGIAALPVLSALAATKDHANAVIGAAVYGFCFLLLFSFSTLYHAFQHPKVKRVLHVFDHISIYFLIAGTYTPFLLNYMMNTTGIVMLSVLWGLTLIGIFFKIFFTGRLNYVSTVIYLGMGWILLFSGRQFFDAIPLDVMIMIIIGGVLYSIGVIFYLWEKFLYHHLIWHLFVLAAAICHYVAVLLMV
ncbi:PAQR family membrane homeostasis protein TrhA [Lacibacter sp.]|jgi:hemolysin III|uniref:PAQR family membrane homeostasis protein TrhA n=1 Tax=Lacibacter sp. TaxID=1915409 RepID=UPI002B4AEE5A|nr:hemolysin III family protein [Lacibacter sp.]HLP36188.1 hemolysin III family protein [Lacibacter sp.]